MEQILVKIENKNGILVTTSNRVAEELGVRHDNLLNKIDDYVNKFSSPELSGQFYIPSEYKTRDGRTVRNYLITKKGIAQLIGGYNSSVEKAFDLNVAYINRFEEMEQILSNKKDSDWLLTREKGKLVRRKETDVIQDLIMYATEQGSQNSGKLYMTYSKLVNKLVGVEPNSRDKIEFKKLISIQQLEDLFSKVIKDNMDKKVYYKEIYQKCKELGTQYIAIVNYDIKLLEVA
ncbi:Rha family transcriptional regulator [Fusobacterium ulcerans]|jgi:Rha family phage regulatory protein|uniref:Rha family transcriptional regulator n=1 Tax=Fusobacterium ulcerans TaxID=861 RepID=UPI002673E3E6|nr:Rha family transcriptional regulator [Fusobacterium ulcerans]